MGEPVKIVLSQRLLWVVAVLGLPRPEFTIDGLRESARDDYARKRNDGETLTFHADLLVLNDDLQRPDLFLNCFHP